LADRAGAGPWPRLARLARIESRARAVTLVRVAGILAVVGLAEATFLLAGLVTGALAALAVLAVLLALAGVHRGLPEGRAAIALSVLPLLRVLSISLPSILVPQWIWHAETGIPVIVATALAARLAGLGASEIGLRRPEALETIVAAGAGLLLGLVAARITDAVTIVSDRSILTAALASLAVIIGAAAAEELLFRGLLLRVAEGIVAGSGIAASALLSTLMYVATLNPRYIVFIAAVSLVLGVITRRSGSLGPALACHATLVWSQLILWPALLG